MRIGNDGRASPASGRFATSLARGKPARKPRNAHFAPPSRTALVPRWAERSHGMLSILAPSANKTGYCDGVSRRNFLRIGALGLGGLTLPQLLRAEAQQGTRQRHKSVIMIFLPGGPAHQDLFDLKMDAPEDVRGPFKPIDTSVAGIQICELMPKIAKRMDKISLIRSIVGCDGDHDAFQCLVGRPKKKMPPGG